jgi:O-antigen biosynthesis protein
VTRAGLRRLRRLVVPGTPAARPISPPPRDRFAAFRALDGPDPVGGPEIRHEAALDGQGRVVVLMPHLDLSRMSGGPNTIFQVTGRLLRRGFRLCYVGTFGPLSPDRAAIEAHMAALTGIEADADRVTFNDASSTGAVIDVGSDDIFVATWWPTAHVANAALGHVRAREFIYLIQDYEPGFYPWSTKYALAAATYQMPVRAIVNEPVLLEFLVRSGIDSLGDASRAIPFQPAVDRRIFAPRAIPRDGPRRLAFYARPKHARNLFEIGLRALRDAADSGLFDGADWEFLAIGEDIPELALSDRHVLRPVPWMTYEVYADFLRNTDVLLSLMLSPHTSYPPLEMAATGGIAVTNTFATKTVETLAAISPGIRAGPPDVPGILAAITDAVGAVTTTSGLAPLGLPATWDEAVEPVTDWFAQRIEELRAG